MSFLYERNHIIYRVGLVIYCKFPVARVSRDPFYLDGITLVPTWMNNYIQFKMCDELIYPFPNVNGATVEV